jgi:hypothetical protein
MTTPIWIGNRWRWRVWTVGSFPAIILQTHYIIDITDPYPAIDRTSKNQVEWHKMETGCQTSFRHNIEFHSTSGAAFYARTRIDTNPLWRLLFDDFIIKSIVCYTNEEAARCGVCLFFTPEELLLFIAILYARGLFCQKMSLNEMWSHYGPTIIKGYQYLSGSSTILFIKLLFL